MYGKGRTKLSYGHSSKKAIIVYHMSQIELLFDNSLYSLKLPPIASTKLGATLTFNLSIVLKDILKQFLLHSIGY